MGDVTCYCRVCGKPFKARRASAAYCSASHKSQYHREKRNGLNRNYDGMDALTKARLRFVAKVCPQAATMVHEQLKANGRGCGESVINAAFMSITSAMNTEPAIIERWLQNYSMGIDLSFGVMN